jgi:plasmid maintenance system antidote protein VapI
MTARKTQPKKRRTIADQLKEAIRRSGKTPYQLSQESGVSQAVLSRFLGGTRDITLGTADKLCETLGLDLL